MNALFDTYAECAANVQPRHRQWAIKAGMSPAHIWSAPAAFGVARIEPTGNTFQFSDGGSGAVIVPVCDDYQLESFEYSIADLLAFLPGNPGRWWMYRDACPVLNAAAVDRAAILNIPLVIRATPLSWLAADRDGLCVLDWNTNLHTWLASGTRLLCENEILSRRILGALKARFPQPEIRHMEPRNAA